MANQMLTPNPAALKRPRIGPDGKPIPDVIDLPPEQNKATLGFAGLSPAFASGVKPSATSAPATGVPVSGAETFKKGDWLLNDVLGGVPGKVVDALRPANLTKPRPTETNAWMGGISGLNDKSTASVIPTPVAKTQTPATIPAAAKVPAVNAAAKTPDVTTKPIDKAPAPNPPNGLTPPEPLPGSGQGYVMNNLGASGVGGTGNTGVIPPKGTPITDAERADIQSKNIGMMRQNEAVRAQEAEAAKSPEQHEMDRLSGIANMSDADAQKYGYFNDRAEARKILQQMMAAVNPTKLASDVAQAGLNRASTEKVAELGLRSASEIKAADNATKRLVSQEQGMASGKGQIETERLKQAADKELLVGELVALRAKKARQTSGLWGEENDRLAELEALVGDGAKAQTKNLPTVSGKNDPVYISLPKGSLYIGPDGIKSVKP